MPIQVIDKIKQKNNGTFALMDAADIEMADGKRLDEKAEEIAKKFENVDEKLTQAASKSPIFDLNEIGLPAIPVSGEAVNVATDTTEIMGVLSKGAAYFTLTINHGENTTVNTILMNPNNSTGLCNCTYEFSNTEILVLAIMKNSILAFMATIKNQILPSVTSEDNDKIAKVVDGKWTAVIPEDSGEDTGSVMWKDIIDRPFEVLENGTVIPLDNRFLEPLETTVREIDLFPESTVDGFALDETYGAYTPGFSSAATFAPEPLGTYNVVWDGVFYTCNAFTFDLEGDTFVGLGNGTYVGKTGNDEPFLLAYTPAYGMKQFFANTTETSHTIRVYRTAPAYRLRADYLPMEAIREQIDEIISDALGGDY